MKSFFRIISGLFLLAIMSACGGGGGSPGATGAKVALFTSAPSSINVLPGQSQSFTIGGGVPDYTVSTSNTALTVNVSGTTLTISASTTTTGTFNVVVTDHAGTQVNITVIVGTGAALKTSASPNVTLLIGAQSAVYSITGGSGLYISAVSNGPGIASVNFNQNAGTFIISGVAAGTTTVTVTDSQGAQVSISVTVGTGITFFTSAPSNINLSPGSLSSVYQIGGGSGVYNVASSSSNVRVNFIPGGSAFSLVGISAGSALVTVTDTQGGTQTISVTVGTGSSLFINAPFSIAVPVGATSSTYQIGGGSGIYFASSSNASVATVTLTSSGINSAQFTITGVSQGTASIIVSDSLGASQQLTVTVGSSGGTLVTSASGSINIAVGASAAYKVQGGNAPYAVGTSNASVATATITGGTLTVTGNAIGQATLTVLDSSSQTVTISVQVGAVSKLFTSAPSSITLSPGTVSSTFTIAGGSQIYLVSSANNSVATVSLNGSNFIISGVAAGSTSIIITDTNGTTVQINVTVTGATTNLFTTAPDAVTLSAGGGSASYNISGGTAPYSVVSSNTTVLTAVLNGATFQLTGNLSGSATVTIKDAAGVSLTPITVTVSGGTSNALYTNAPSAVQISAGINNAPQYQISGGIAPYSVVSSATAVATVSLSGTTYTVTGIAAGTANIIITDSAGTKLTVAVTVGSSVAIPFYASVPGTITLSVGQSPVPTYTLGGGTAPYIAASSDESVVKATISGSSLILTPVSAGTATVRLVDSAGSSPISTTVTVVTSNVASLGVAPSAVTQAYVGDVLQFSVSGGSAPYTIVSNNPSSVTIGNIVQNTSSATFTATMAKVNNSAVIVVTDSKGTVSQVTISSILAAVNNLSLTPVSWSILDNNNSSVSLTLNGGVPPFQVFTSGTNAALLSSVTVTNNGITLLPSQAPFFTDRTLTIGLGSQGTRCVGADTTLTFTVVDSLNTSTTSTMKILTGGQGC